MITTNKTDIGSTVTIGGKPGRVVGREDVVAYDALKRPQGLNLLVQFEDGIASWVKAEGAK
jgi:hypothetical protein